MVWVGSQNSCVGFLRTDHDHEALCKKHSDNNALTSHVSRSVVLRLSASML